MEDDGKGIRPPFVSYQGEIFARGILEGSLPQITTDPNKLRLHAKKVLHKNAYNYIAGAAGEGATNDANRLAFRQWKIIPRMMRPTVPRDLKITLFGEQYGM
ncbi:hypothetical protein O1611_g9452 [Lasiodiplodia mahajangana]|uniref:Uncharacterized protein n=1 Tax=Lasiodiplodia mahajangana TaxID=1108764 RepID=A0ACC2J9J2_9PEZI|nr:hypothetical protein O1611_g9452 [Lasiodiplodia mahajangana]